MAGLTDITFYDESVVWQHAGEPERKAFRRLANYISDLYVQCLHGYKPPKIARICIKLEPDNMLPTYWKFGSIVTIKQFFQSQLYDLMPDAEKASFLLDALQDAVRNLCHQYQWDLEVFDRAYDEVQGRNLLFQFEYPQKFTRDGKKRAHLLLQKTLTTTSLFACIVSEETSVRATLYEGPNHWWYDPIYAVTKYGRWISNDQFGIKTTRHDFQAWFSLQSNRVCVE